MPTSYTDQFFVLDPAGPPAGGSALNFQIYTLVDFDDDGDVGAAGGDTVNGGDVTASWPGDTVTIDIGGGVLVTYTGVTFYIAGQPAVFTPTDGQILQNGTFVSSTAVSTSTPLDVDDLGPPCFVRGTRIKTSEGYKRIENLWVGDMVETADHGPQEIQWIGNRKVRCGSEFSPIRIEANVLGNSRDLLVSPQHKMLISGWRAELYFGEEEALVPAKALINDKTIYVQEQPMVEYIHLMFENHEIIFAEGAPTESFDPGGDLALRDPHLFKELSRIFPERFSDVAMDLYQTARSAVRFHEGMVLA